MAVRAMTGRYQIYFHPGPARTPGLTLFPTAHSGNFEDGEGEPSFYA